MTTMRMVWLAAGSMLLCAPMYTRQASSQVQKPAATDVSSHASLVNRSCVSCHSDKLKTGGLSLQQVDVTSVSADAAVWEKVLRKVRSGEMPPPTVRTRPQPEALRRSRFPRANLDRAAAASPNPGRAPVHRLNRAEYSNAIRDLLAVDVKPGAWLPVDDSGYGFDNIAAVLSTSPALLERYMTAARRISRLAIGDLTLKPVEDIYDAKRDPDQGDAQRAAQRRSAVRFARRHIDSALFSRRRRVRVQDPHPGSADRRERTGDRPVPDARPRQGGTPLGRRHVAARESEGRKRRHRGPGAAAPAAEAAAFRRCRFRSISG